MKRSRILKHRVPILVTSILRMRTYTQNRQALTLYNLPTPDPTPALHLLYQTHPSQSTSPLISPPPHAQIYTSHSSRHEADTRGAYLQGPTPTPSPPHTFQRTRKKSPPCTTDRQGGETPHILLYRTVTYSTLCASAPHALCLSLSLSHFFFLALHADPIVADITCLHYLVLAPPDPLRLIACAYPMGSGSAGSEMSRGRREPAGGFVEGLR
jgi:hypothetical protein